MQCVMSAVKPSAHHLCWYKWLVDVFSPIFQTCSIWFHWSICQWSTGYPWCWDGCSWHVSTAFAWSSISEIKCISVLWGSWQLWGNGILAFPDTFHEYQWAQDFLLKFLFPSEMRFNAMPSGLAFLPAAVFFWDCCLVIVWFRPYSIALVINVELITMCWVITGCSAFLGLFWLFQIPLSLGRRLLHLTPLN